MNLETYIQKHEITQRAFAIRLGVTPGLIYQWLRGLRRIAAEQVLPIVRATNGEVTPHDLRPDIYPDPGWLPSDVADTPPKHN